MEPLLRIDNPRVKVENKEIIRGLNLSMGRGEFHRVMGPNGSGKSTLALAVMGHSGYEIVEGKIEFEGEVVNSISPDERARKGIFLAFQHPRK